MREKHHRLSRESYRGKISAAFTLCLKAASPGFVEPRTIDVFVAMLGSAALDASCVVPVYCYMPDHQHMILTGTHDDSDLWEVVARYKQRSGFWMSKHTPTMQWQKDFYDHVIRAHEEVVAQVRYVLDNPVRSGLVSSWREYPFKGSCGCDLEEVLKGVFWAGRRHAG